jgi:dTDP-4-dehydrorhamnose reductase
MRVLVTGARGQVGQAFAASAPSSAALDLLGHADLDIGEPEAVDAMISARRPDVILNAAAYTAVDRAESEAEAARRVNGDGPTHLARAAARHGARLLHLSTDFVFDGSSSTPYEPNDATAPLNVYGSTKLAGEQGVRAHLPEAVILRTSWVYDGQGKNFLVTMLRLMKERGAVRVISDQVGTPTSARSIAAVLWALIDRPAVTGTLHWTDSGVASWYDFAVAIAEERERLTGHRAAVAPIGTKDYPTPAKRPRYSVLDKSSAVEATGLTPPHWGQNLRRIMGEMSLA